MSVFTVNPKKLVEVKLNYIVGKNGELVVLNDNPNCEHKTATAMLARQTWAAYQDCLQRSYIYNAEFNSHSVDAVALKHNTFKTLIRSLVDGDNEEVVLDDDFFATVNPDFLISIVNKYEKTIDNEKIKLLMSVQVNNTEEDKKDKEDKENEDKKENKEG